MTVSIWSVIIGLGAFHGFFLTVILFVRGNGFRTANLWFGLIVLIFSYTLLEFTLLVSGQIINVIHIFSWYVPLMFLLGPFLLFFVRENLGSKRAFTKFNWLHFVPSLLVLISFIPFYRMNASSKLSIFQGLYEVGEGISTNMTIFNIVFFIHLGCYILAARRSVQTHQHYSSRLSKIRSRVKSLGAFMIAFYTIGFLSFLLIVFPSKWRMEILYSLIFSLTILIYFISYRLLLVKESIVFGRASYEGKKINKEAELNERFKTLLCEEKLFLNPGVKLQDLADKLDISHHQLSQLVNQRHQTNFSGLMNEHRIKEAKKLLKSQKDEKLLGIALDCGFSSQSSFIRVFRKHTGMTPSQFRDSPKN